MQLNDFVDGVWETDILPALQDYIRIPNQSVAFDPDWEAHGHMAAAVDLIEAWARSRSIEGATVDVQRLPGRTPVILVDVPACGGGPADDTVLLYGHLDKQPPMLPWRSGLDPWTPKLEGDRLYGRGAADDGYAAFAALTAIEAVQRHGGSHARCLVLIEASEESGSPDLPAHLSAMGERRGSPSFVIALDSWCWTSDRLWLTTSLRGIVSVDVTVEVLTEGVHSGGAGGVVPSSFKALRQLVSRVEDDETGRILLPELHVPIPDERRAQIDAVASELDIADSYPWAPGVRPLGTGPADQITARTWRPCMEVLAMGGAPPIGHGGNVLRPYTSATLGFRVPPRCDARAAGEAVVRVLTTDPPHGAHVRARVTAAEGGWDAPPTAPWLEAALSAASTAAFGQEHRAIGEGGTIPFMGMLGAQLPDAQFCITGVLGPGSNAHGPNEFLHIPTATRVTAATAHLLDAHARR